MIAYTIRRLAVIVPILLAVSLLTFTIINLAPGDPLLSILGPDASPDARARVRKEMNLDDPFWIRYLNWIGDAVRGDLGTSIFLNQPVSVAIWNRFPVTLSLGIGALVVALAIGLPLGVIAALNPNGVVDTIVMIIALAGLSTPEFLLGLGLMYVFAVVLGWLPVGGFIPLTQDFVAGIRHLLMPSFTLGFIWAAYLARMTRANMVDILSNDYIKVARSKGLREYLVILKHALRNAIIPVTTATGFVIILIVAGAFITEIVFNISGIGSLVVNSVLKRDYPVVQGSMLFVASGVLLINLFVDLLYAYLDPRIKYE